MGDAVSYNAVSQGFNNRTLTDNLIKCLGSGFPGKNEVRHAAPGLEVSKMSNDLEKK
jgi:hypothetical protein